MSRRALKLSPPPVAPRRSVVAVGVVALVVVLIGDLIGHLPASRSAPSGVGGTTDLAVTVSGLAALWLVGTAAVLDRARRVASDRRLWRAVALLVGTLGAALTAQPLLARALVDHPPTALPWVPAAVAVLVCFLPVYGAFVRWNLTRTHSADPDDRLNAVSAVLTGQALFGVLAELLGGPLTRLPWWQSQLLLAATAAAIVLGGTVLSTAMLARGGRDRSTWLVTASGFPALLGLLGLVVAPSGTSYPGTLAALAAALLLLVVASVQRAALAVPQVVQGAPATWGAYGVVVLAVVVMAVAGLLHTGADASAPLEWAVVTAGLGAAGAATRLLFNLGELDQLADTHRQARTDELTGLANRRGLLGHADAVLERGTPFVLALVDLDRFKEVNDGLGHAAGDALLIAAAARLREAAGRGAEVGRLGGDEFALLLPLSNLASSSLTPEEAAAEGARAWGERIVTSLLPAYHVGQAVVHVGGSTGLAVHTGAVPFGADIAQVRSEVLRRADAAMYSAKRAGGGWAIYDAEVHGDGEHALRTAEDLRRAISQGELVLHYQPQITVADGELAGVEALVRWQHPGLGLLLPGRFLPVAEDHGLIGQVTWTVLQGAVRQSAEWRRAGLDLRVSVNVSATDLLDPDLPRALGALLLQHRVPPARLVLEVTETTLVRDQDRASQVLAELADLGVATSIDDFGTGWSSLAQLHRMRFSELKLDRSFTRDLLTHERAAAITASTVDLAHALGLRVVAEGVEDAETLARLASLGCDESQGYWHAVPMPADALVEWAAHHREEALPRGW
ncbi:diguanylate cyclase (GGDEF) domain-containing protein [Quadrisphaera granulorum]|uniref:Diguanylate cyclase (GGDEF)-like protein n=1 Tax=Quadrisphaera granulorum TaxID=317664 RepID=A0A316ABE4_9ACTN|nr:bifunctional diguanylate cyclase/phosphodiesterase [Quadrisphaera granulorum]PWJ54902.1 diguanylate cyclase (GGDEF)-like protein [Quadrisphaera granulorum]SZE95848.1 diguanylate cyclase (GGDEF) domain-containing protein [Quadrisphaera granulorum]